MNWFFYEFTPSYPWISSAIKFLILGTLGEWIGGIIKKKGKLMPFSPVMFIPKIFIWAILGVVIKWAFSSFASLIPLQAEKGLIPEICKVKGSFYYALAVSIQINVFFAPFMMYFHRLMDNIAERKMNWKGMKVAIFSIGWFWIPAHTITFMLPPNFRIIMAAALGVALGIILGFAAMKK